MVHPTQCGIIPSVSVFVHFAYQQVSKGEQDRCKEYGEYGFRYHVPRIADIRLDLIKVVYFIHVGITTHDGITRRDDG